jgi:ABC-2 type transport system permease protein
MNKTLLGFVRKELIQTLRDPRMRFVLFVIPVIQLFLYGVAISHEIKNIRITASFDPKDYIARHIYERAIYGTWFIPAKSNHTDPYKMIQSGEADVVLIPEPGGFTRAIGRGEGKLQILINSVNVLKAQTIESYLKNIIQRSIQDDLKLKPTPPPIQFDVRVLFNPDLNTAIFMIPGTMCILMIIATLVMTNNAIVREKEMGTFEMLISAPITGREVILGKTVPYLILGMAQFPLILAVAVFVFGVPERGPLLVLIASTLAFVLTTVAMGTLISTFCKNQQQASLATFLFLFPAIMFSGLLFPIENMPKYIQWIAYLDPIAHYMGLLRNVMLKGGEVYYISTRIGILVLLAAGSIVVSFKRFHTTLR